MQLRLVVSATLLAALPALAHAQTFRRYADEPTGAADLTIAPLAGDFDARAVAVNPGGLQLLDGGNLTFALDLENDDTVASQAQGGGLYLAGPVGGGSVLPRFGLGAAVEVLRPPRGTLDPDPGAPWRLSLAASLGIGRHAGVGVALRHFYDDGPAQRTTTFDVGLAARFGNHAAVSAVVRDVNAPTLGVIPVQRRYELEMMTRPFGTDRLELGAGGRIGETRAAVDGWLRLSARAARGVYVQGAIESRSLPFIDVTPSGVREGSDRDLLFLGGVALSFGKLGAAGYVRGRVDEDDHGHATGGSLVLSVSSVPPPPVQGHGERIERIELAGALSARELTAVVLRLRQIRRDRHVKGVVISLDGIAAGWGSLQDLREELRAVSQSGTKVFAYLVAASARDYWVATAADKIYLDPAGGIRLVGFAGTTMYFKGAFDKLGVLPQFEKIAEYKSAPEQYTEVGPTEPALRMRNELYDSLWDTFVAGIADGRRLDRAAVIDLIDRGPYTAGQLENEPRLVDGVAKPERVAELIAIELGGLAPVGRAPVERDDRWVRRAIAVIYADGDIVDGKSMTVPFLGRKLVGSQTIVNAISAARAAPEVGAIVLRIDSPGGSALASEIMAREVFKTRGVKPIICSMGDVAASGGYFLAAGCDVIFAEPMTITGSIGIFYGKFDVSGLASKLGITTETFKRGARADMESMYRPYTEEERAVLLDRLRYFYGRFTETVAEGRKMTQARVDELGRGRVWSGTQAASVGLVDRLGGVGDAIALAKQRMGVPADEPVRIISLPRPSPGLLGWLGALVGARAQAPALELGDLPAVRSLLDGIPASVLVAPEAMQARLPFDVVWE